jgi:hypothetical protein
MVPAVTAITIVRFLLMLRGSSASALRDRNVREEDRSEREEDLPASRINSASSEGVVRIPSIAAGAVSMKGALRFRSIAAGAASGGGVIRIRSIAAGGASGGGVIRIRSIAAGGAFLGEEASGSLSGSLSTKELTDLSRREKCSSSA